MVEDLFSSPTPFTPPTTEEDRLSWLRLIRSHRVGCTTFFRLLGEYGSAEAALQALPEVARAAGVTNYTPAPPDLAEAELRAGQALGARLIAFGMPDYPAPLAAIPDPPPVFWALGDLTLLQRPMLALVGARNASSLGLRMARALAGGLAEAGFAVVSGLARGIDAAAHAAALDRGTVAVQAGGVDVRYPTENAALADRIAAQGLRLSEQPVGLAPQARHFPRRNRIISGLSQAVLVVEAAARSGSLITARGALDQGREVLAVPGHPFDARAAGCNALIREGATLVRDVADVVAALERAGHPPLRRPLPPMPPRLRATAPEAPEGATQGAAGQHGPAAAPRLPQATAPGSGAAGADARAGGDSIAGPTPAPRRTVAAPAGQHRTAPPRLPARAPGGASAPATPDSNGSADHDPRQAAGRPAGRAGSGLDRVAAAVAASPAPAGTPPAPLRDTAALHAAILGRLGPSPMAEDQLIRDLAVPAARVAPELLALELDGRVARQPGGLLCRVV